MDAEPSKQTTYPVAGLGVCLTAPEKRRLRQGLPLLPRPSLEEVLAIAGTFEDDAILSNEEIEAMGTHG